MSFCNRLNFHALASDRNNFFVLLQVGNTLVIAAVITTRRLRSVTNCFVSSLAAADLLVGLAVMPPAVLLQLTGGTWELGEVLCDSWVSLDILLCTASILSLCAISIDR
ncbi:Beta-3 adrenergic receptor [Ooceraea biroi]|nr:Beta-3 adrenergic receptor [Ooceraea biroi]